MTKIYENLGRKVWKYRKENNLSTENFANRIGISAGLVNNIENAKYDVFKLDLLSKIINELGVPPGEVLPLYDIDTKPSLNMVDSDSEVTELCNEQLKLICNSFIATISEYGCTKENVNTISQHIRNELETLTKLHRLNR